MQQLAVTAPLEPGKFMIPQMSRPDKHEWRSTYIIEDISIPAIADYPTIHKLFKIQILYRDTQTDKQFSKTHFFGERDDFIFTKDGRQRMKRLAHMKNVDNPLHPNYWRVHLCMSGDDFKDNFRRMTDFILDRRLGTLPTIKSGIGQKKAPIRVAPKVPEKKI